MKSVIVTAYCACRLCCSDGDGLTASMRPPAPGVTVAANWLPLGTVVNIGGIGIRRVEDRMHRRYARGRIDVYVRSHKQAQRFGVRTARVEVVR